MGKRLGKHQKGIPFLIKCLAVATLLMGGCATPAADQIQSSEVKGPFIEQINVSPSPSETAIEIVNSRSVPYTAFRLIDPPRIILDIRGEPGSNLPRITEVNNENVKEIRFEEGKTQIMTTRMVVNLVRLLDYEITATDNIIRLTLKPKQAMPKAEEQPETKVSTAVKDSMESGKEQFTPAKPRVLFKPRPSGLNQVLGVDFTMLDHGKSQLIVTTDKKVRYDLERKGKETLILTLSETTIPPLLLRDINASHFPGALDGIKPAFSSTKKQVLFTIALKEMVPYHVKQTDNGLSIEFGRSSIKPPEKKIIPLQLAQAETKAPAAEAPEAKKMKFTPGIQRPEKRFKGERMYLDFVNADVTHILRLINDVSKENIIWDPAIKGKKVSMILKDVPWDEALELILKNNDLGKRYVGKNIIWITTKAKIKQLIAEEEAQERKRQKQIEAEKKKRDQEKKKAKAEEKLKTEYIPVDFATASEIQGHIVLSKRGKMSIDTRTNKIIITDTASSIKQAKETVRVFDTPVKQIMIEARIVDASTSFSRDLGLKWGNISGTGGGIQAQRRSTDTMSWSGTPLWATGNSETSFPAAHDQRIAGSFTTSSPTNWGANIGLNFARLSGNLLGGLGLDASLALAESEGNAKVISAPKVIAREGTAASISSGDTIIIPATENVASTTLPATLSLTVTPTTVSFNNFITLQVSVTDDQAPTTSRLLTKAISTTLMIKSGDTVVIGGIIKESEGEDETGIPVLRDMPGVGWLFKARNRVSRKSELLIFLTPTVLPSPVKPL